MLWCDLRVRWHLVQTFLLHQHHLLRSLYSRVCLVAFLNVLEKEQTLLVRSGSLFSCADHFSCLRESGNRLRLLGFL